MTDAPPTNPIRSAAGARSWRGAAIFSRGFRPFFLAAGVWALVGVALWPFIFVGAVDIPTAFSPVDWHAHEMIFGYVGAVVAGFLMTAIPNWTGRLPVTGRPLAALVALWAAGRLAIFASAIIGRPAAAATDAAFLVVFTALVAREVIAGRNWRNAKVVALVAALGLANIAFHFEDARVGFAEYTQRAALGLIVMLILLIGGRVTPSFTNNGLARSGATLRPVPYGAPDGAILVLSGVALAFWAVAPETSVTGALSLAAGAANLWRLSRWRGLSVRRDAMLLVLHIGFLFAALGFFVAGAHALWPALVSYPAGVHVWAVGAVGLMTLAMMTRATLGHTGRALVATPGMRFAYLCVIAAAFARLAMSEAPALTMPLMVVAAAAWILAFAAFLLVLGPILIGNGGPARR